MKKFRHYKGGIYTFIGVGIHTETEEELVFYTNGKGELFARPLNMWLEWIIHEGALVQRFTELEEGE